VLLYPTSLADHHFLGEWDKIAIASVEYRRLKDGSELNVVKGWVGEPTLAYPPAPRGCAW
jgi:hypothetical protein